LSFGGESGESSSSTILRAIGDDLILRKRPEELRVVTILSVENEDELDEEESWRDGGKSNDEAEKTRLGTDT